MRRNTSATTPFCFTYGDGVADVDIRKVIEFHRESGSIATVTAVQPPGAVTARSISTPTTGRGRRFQEKPHGSVGLGERRILRRHAGDPRLHQRRRHHFRAGAEWKRLSMDERTLLRTSTLVSGLGMDTLWDKVNLDNLWVSGKAPWKV